MRPRGLAVLVATLVVALAVGGCLKRSKLARSYVLDPLTAQGLSAPAAAAVAAVGVERVTIPDWLDRPQVTGRGASGAIVTDEYSRWGEPLPRGIQRVVAENLVTLMPDRRVLSAPFPPRDAVDQRLELTIVEAARQTDGSVLVEARWDVVGAAGEVLLRRRSSHRSSPTAPGAAGAVEGLNGALAALSREMADALRTLPPPAKSADK
jgi:uncharacterized lipoprotein YmbA